MTDTDARRAPRVLFICSQNRMRSPTAEAIFTGDQRWLVKSAGVESDAAVCLDEDLLAWADVVFVMEQRHRNIIRRRFPALFQTRRIVALHIPDEYDYMDSALIELLRQKVGPYLERLCTADE